MAFQYQPPTGALSGLSFEQQTTSFLQELQDAMQTSNTQFTNKLNALQQQVDGIDTGNFVTLAGVQTVTGGKTFTSAVQLREAAATNRLLMQLYNVVKGTAPQSSTYAMIIGHDSQGTAGANRIGTVEVCADALGNHVSLNAYTPVAGSSSADTLVVHSPYSGPAYATAPQTREEPIDTEIVTWNKAKALVSIPGSELTEIQSNIDASSEDQTYTNTNTETSGFWYVGGHYVGETAAVTIKDNTNGIEQRLPLPSAGAAWASMLFPVAKGHSITVTFTACDQGFVNFISAVNSVGGVDTGGGSGGGDALLDGDNTWTGNNTFENPVAIGDSTAATQDWTLNNAIGVIPGDVKTVYQEGISTTSEEVIMIEETEFSAWWFIFGTGSTSGNTNGYLRIRNLTNSLSVILECPATWSEGTCLFVPKGHKVEASFGRITNGSLSYVKAVFASNTEISDGVPGDTALTVHENVTASGKKKFSCAATPANGQFTLYGSASTTNGFLWIHDATNATDSFTNLDAGYTAGGTLHVAAGHEVSFELQNVTNAKILWTPDKGQPDTAPGVSETS